MPSASTTLFAPDTSSRFDCRIDSDILYISGKSWRYHTYTLSVTYIYGITNNTSVALKVTYWWEEIANSIILFPRERVDVSITGTITIYPCVEMNLFSLE